MESKYWIQKKQKTSKQGNMGKLLTNYKTDGIKILDPKKNKKQANLETCANF